MPMWIPEKVWDGQDVFIIGGGTSLKTFDWSLLKKELTIGCNDAYKHGVEICKICIFGDASWFKIHKDKLAHYKGTVFTNYNALQKADISWLWSIPRKTYGLGINTLGWNGNTGAAAVNLAILLGAKNIFLLGFDMKLSKDGKANWHENKVNKPDAYVYNKFIQGFLQLKKDLVLFPDVNVFNVTDDSDLNTFPKIGINKFWNERIKIGA